MKRIALITLASLALPFTALAGGTGVGVAHGTSGLDFTRDDTTIFVPIALGNAGFWIEPFVTYADVEFDAAGGGTADGDAFSIGLGLFNDMHVTKNTSAYLGGRVGYVDTDFSLNAPSGTTTGSADGWSVSPTLGFGYSPAPSIMFGAEAFVSYNTLEDDANNEIDSLGTGTNLFARYFFNAQ